MTVFALKTTHIGVSPYPEKISRRLNATEQPDFNTFLRGLVGKRWRDSSTCVALREQLGTT
jgi:hypothetical protein